MEVALVATMSVAAIEVANLCTVKYDGYTLIASISAIVGIVGYAVGCLKREIKRKGSEKK